MIAYVPDFAIKSILVQLDSDGKRGMWIAKMLEVDLEIKPTKLIKGQGLARLVTEINLDAFGINFVPELLDLRGEESMVKVEDCFKQCPWYADVVYILQNLQVPLGIDRTRARFLRLKSVKYCLLNGYLNWKDLQGILLNCLLEDKTKKMSKDFHEGACGGHHYWKATIDKILRAGFYWHTLFFDVRKEVAACHKC